LDRSEVENTLVQMADLVQILIVQLQVPIVTQ